MKIKSHSGTKKRVKVRKSGTVMVQKSARNHLLINKSKKQKGSFINGMPVHPTMMVSLRRQLPGKVTLKKNRNKVRPQEEVAA